MGIELKIMIHGNDTCFEVDYTPDTGIEEVMVSSHGDQVVIDTEGLFVAQGIFPDVKTVPLFEELSRLAEMEFAERRADWEDMKRDEALEHRMEG